MRTNVELDDELMAEALESTGLKISRGYFVRCDERLAAGRDHDHGPPKS